jgi:hypothetical protein
MFTAFGTQGLSASNGHDQRVSVSVVACRGFGPMAHSGAAERLLDWLLLDLVRLSFDIVRHGKRLSGHPGRRATVTLHRIEGILAAAAAAGVAHSAQLEPLQAGVAVRSVGVQESECVSEAALLWLWGALAELPAAIGSVQSSRVLPVRARSECPAR